MIYNWQYQNQYLFGHGIMVAPIVSYKEINKVYLPKGIWYNMFTEQSYTGNQELYVETPIEVLPVYVKGGSIIPMQTVVQSAMGKPADTLFVHVYRGGENNSFVYYEDAGDGYDYLNGKFFKRLILYNANANELVFEKAEGSFVSKFIHIKLFMHGFNELKNLFVDGQVSSTKKETLELLGGISQFDPIGKSINASKTEIQSVLFKNATEKVVVRW
jgi:alpha-glucosidase